MTYGTNPQQIPDPEAGHNQQSGEGSNDAFQQQASYQPPADPYAQPSYGQAPYGQAPYGQAPYTPGAQGTYAAGAQGTYAAGAQGPYAPGVQGQYAGAYYGGAPVEQRSAIVAGILGILVGIFGIHNFYVGRTSTGIAQLLITLLSFGILSFITGIWGLIEGILFLVSDDPKWRYDARGILLKR